MAYITMEYYVGTFQGKAIPESDFPRLAETASDVIDMIATKQIDVQSIDTEKLAKATAYEMETLYSQGGIDATTGKASSQLAVTERLDEYSISEQQSNSAAENTISINGIPVSPVTVSILRSLGLMCRWYYAGMGDHHGV